MPPRAREPGPQLSRPRLSGGGLSPRRGADGNVQAASETCYQTLASNDEAALTDKKSNIGQCARGAAGATTPLAMTLALVGAMVLASLA